MTEMSAIFSYQPPNWEVTRIDRPGVVSLSLDRHDIIYGSHLPCLIAYHFNPYDILVLVHLYSFLFYLYDSAKAARLILNNYGKICIHIE